jgi:hypothetical protein
VSSSGTHIVTYTSYSATHIPTIITTPPSDNNNNNNNGTNKGAIIGGVVGGVAFLAIVGKFI